MLKLNKCNVMLCYVIKHQNVAVLKKLEKLPGVDTIGRPLHVHLGQDVEEIVQVVSLAVINHINHLVKLILIIPKKQR